MKTSREMRALIRESEGSVSDLARRLGLNRKTVAKWKQRASIQDMRPGPVPGRMRTMSAADADHIRMLAAVTDGPLCRAYAALRPSFPKLSRSSFYRIVGRAAENGPEPVPGPDLPGQDPPLLSTQGDESDHHDPKRRRTILGSAGELFLELGYEQTTMARIAQRSGLSRSTIWRHFRSKEDVFNEYLKSAVLRFAIRAPDLLIPKGDDEATLRSFCLQYISAIHAPEALALYRLILGSASRFQERGSALMALVLSAGEEALLEFIERCMAQGTLRPGDPRQATRTLFSLCEGPCYHQALLGIELLDDRGIVTESDGVADTFLRLYGTGNDKPSAKGE